MLAESGVSRGSLYHHFKGKEALFLAVMEDVGARHRPAAEEAARDAPDPVAALRAGAWPGSGWPATRSSGRSC